jgi:protein gp37
MGELTQIEWTQATWNPWHGCHKVSQGCKYCYMFRDKARYGQDPNVVVRSKTKFSEPLKWTDPKLIFTCSWSDWFIEEADGWRCEAYNIIGATPHHTYQILTKRADRIQGRFPYPPLSNVWLGVSVENKAALSRIDILREVRASVRFLSLEPLLEDLGPLNLDGIHWVIAGGESGPEARAVDPEWVRSIRDQCIAAGVPFFFKQWGEWYPLLSADEADNFPRRAQMTKDHRLIRIGKKAAGRTLDGRTWDEMPVMEAV